MVNAKISIGKKCFEINLFSKLSIIDDNSDTGKSYLYSLVDNFPGNHAKIQCDIPVVAVDSIYDFAGIKEKSIIVIDEDCKCLGTTFSNDLNELFQTLDCYFIIVCRNSTFARISHSVDDIYVFKAKQGKRVLEKKYPEPLFQKNPPQRVKKIFIEDYTTGYTFFKFLRKDTNSFMGKDNIAKALESANDNDLIVLDRCGFGANAKYLYEYLKHTNKQILFLDYDCFESMILEVLGIQCDFTKDFNRESKYFIELHKNLSQYGKSLECSCFIPKKCKCNNCSGQGQLFDAENLFAKTQFANYVKWR